MGMALSELVPTLSRSNSHLACSYDSDKRWSGRKLHESLGEVIQDVRPVEENIIQQLERD